MDTDIFMTSEQHFRILIPSDFQAFIEEFQKTSTSFLLKKLSQIKRFFFFFSNSGLKSSFSGSNILEFFLFIFLLG